MFWIVTIAAFKSSWDIRTYELKIISTTSGAFKSLVGFNFGRI